ncbi:MAG TPA: nuclear transport factor 2 family protein [Steroidobacteraceae bacterium]|nr:nuclear transport factor 2 family protein [Steroidobacteraceae bacterium]
MNLSLIRHTLLALLLVSAPVVSNAESLDQQIDALSLRVEKLEAVRAIKKLQRAFGYYVDRGLWGEASDLFADDGTIEIGLDGIYAGKPHIHDYLEKLGGGQPGLIYGELNEFVTLQPEIDVAQNGRTAQARWRDLGMLGQYHKWAAWRDGTYENTYVQQDGIWKIQTLHLFVNFQAPYEQGWARLKPGEGLKRSQASIELPPDRPSSVVYKPFPDVFVPPFHAPNPVTGKPVETPK